ncbi:MAG TPA: carbohydrate-binding domain-containing protein, partial [Lacipirellula sp.]
MIRTLLHASLSLLLTASVAGAAYGQSTRSGSSLALKSSGDAAAGGGWTLEGNGFVGTYITLANPGEVTVEVEASGVSHNGEEPRLNLVIADSSASFDVAAGNAAYAHTFSLPAGTHFVRADLSNDSKKSPRELTVGSVTVTGAGIANSNSNANALAAANSYIENFRKGDARLTLVGVQPGAEVQVKLKDHAFN